MTRFLRALAIVTALLVGVAGARAMTIDEKLPDPAQEARVIALSKGLRCLVCQNQSIEDSNADLARDLRRTVRERVAAGDSDEQVRAFLVARFGDWVLLKPPFKSETLILWIAPVALLILAGGIAWTFYRRRPEDAPPAPLSAEEKARLSALTDGTTRT
jgi:cytochrome c-type biogenesis protein CcmH